MTKRNVRILPPLLVAFGLFFSGNALAGIKCWTNNEGVRECGNAVPPEYAQKSSRTVNDRGITVDVQERAKTQEELEEERRRAAEEARRKAEEERKRQEKERYDRVLLSTFLNEQELLDSRDRKTAAIDASIELTRISIDKLVGDLEQERKRAAALERRGKDIPESQQEVIGSLERQIKIKNRYIESKQEEKQKLIEKYASDLERFRELKSSGRTLR